MNLKDVKSGVFQITVMFKSIKRSVSKNKKSYTRIEARDNENNEAILYDWNESNPVNVETPILMDVSIEASERNGQVFLELKSYQISSNQNSMISFFPPARINRKEYAKEFCDYTKLLSPKSATLVKAISQSDSKKFTWLPLTEDGAFSYTSGILEATVKLVRLALSCEKEIESLDKELLLCGALLYYMGYPKIMDSSFTYSSDELLTGPGLHASYLIREHGMKLSCDPLFLRDLSHIIMTRQGEMVPALKEAVLLNRLNSLLLTMDEITINSTKCEQNEIFQIGRKKYYNRTPFEQS